MFLLLATKEKLPILFPNSLMLNPAKFGIHLITTEGERFSIGDADEKFSIQSISKVLSLSLAFTFSGEKIWERIGVEPSGNAFNSLIQLEYEQGKPRNPFINVGALVVADMLISHLAEPKKDFLEFVRNLADCPEIDFNYKVARSEKSDGFRNAALANLLKSFGNLENDVEEVLDFYFHQCSIEMTCRELAYSFLFFANEGKTLHKDEQILDSKPDQTPQRADADLRFLRRIRRIRLRSRTSGQKRHRRRNRRRSSEKILGRNLVAALERKRKFRSRNEIARTFDDQNGNVYFLITGEDAGDLSALENPQTVEEIKLIAK